MAIRGIAVSAFVRIVMENTPGFNPNPDQNLEGILQGFSDLNIIVNHTGEILDFRPGSFHSASLPQITIGETLQGFLPQPALEKIEQALQTGQAGAFQYSLPSSEGEYWFEARIAPLANSQFLFVARDVTKCKQTEVQMKRQMQQLSLLRSIDLAIASGLDLNLLLTMLLDQVVELMQVDAAAILLQSPKSNLLEFTVGKGFHSTSLQYTHLRMGEGCAGRVALERKMLNVPDLKANQMEFSRSPLFRMENFVAYYGIPLIAKGRVLGVLEMFHRSTLQPDADWLNFLNMVAGQAAIAIDNAVMFRELQKSNIELSLAYDATIEGLTRALDLRDKETEEHTRRVSDMTVQLAVKAGVGDADLVHIRRGAILHDIGKMAIPDRILFKPGPLNDDEWKIMRRHPGIAVDLLSSVSYLAPALEIPHWHHEKWDGSGYPDRLSGESIPFAARLFALVDVYDALTSNRPYRGAWPKEDTLGYIESQTGKQFDPLMVPKFIQFANSHPI